MHENENLIVKFADGVELKQFSPVAYYDKFLDCIRVYTHDRSVTEERVDDGLTLYRTNHGGHFDPKYSGFCLKGVRHLFDLLEIEQGAELTLTDLIDTMVKHQPHSTMAAILADFPAVDLTIEWEDQIAA